MRVDEIFVTLLAIIGAWHVSGWCTDLFYWLDRGGWKGGRKHGKV